MVLHFSVSKYKYKISLYIIDLEICLLLLRFSFFTLSSVLTSVEFLHGDFFLTEIHLHFINNICDFRTEIINKVNDLDPREARCGVNSLKKYFTGVFSNTTTYIEAYSLKCFKKIYDCIHNSNSCMCFNMNVL